MLFPEADSVRNPAYDKRMSVNLRVYMANPARIQRVAVTEPQSRWPYVKVKRKQISDAEVVAPPSAMHKS